MRDGAPDEVLSGSCQWRPVVSSWLGDTLLAESVPIVSGSLSVDASQQVPERLTLTVPQWGPDGTTMRSWVPDGAGDPLARFGQFLDVAIEVTSSLTGEQWVTGLGRYQIQNSDHDDIGGTVQVEALGLLQRAVDARFRTSQVPRSGGTLASEFTRLMVDGIPVSISGSLVDRACPQTFQWSDDRLGALYDLVDAWPAQMAMDETGTCVVDVPLPAVPTPLMTFTDGVRGTLVSAPTSDTRDGTPNVLVVRSSATDSTAREPVQAVAEILSGPLATSTYGEVVEFYSTPLVVTSAQCSAAAVKVLADRVRGASTRKVTCVPDPRVEANDPVAVIRDGVTALGWVTGYSLPLTIDGGAMSVTVGVSA